MIGWIVSRLADLVVTPQAASATVLDLGAAFGPDPASPPRGISLAAVLDPPDTGEESTQSLSLLALNTRPIGYEIAGDAPAVELRHTVQLALAVTHGDLDAAERIRDAITTELALRLLDNYAALSTADDPATGQQVSRVDFAIDYTPVADLDAPSAWSRLTITVDAELAR